MEVGFEAVRLDHQAERQFEDRKLRVLLVEDCPDTRLLVSTLLDGLGVECNVAFSSEAALDMVSGAQKNGWPYDLLLVDICLPGMDGITMVRVLRGRGFRGRIVAASARVALEDQEECRAAGCDAYINKLSGYSDFLKELRQCLKDCSQPVRNSKDDIPALRTENEEYLAIVHEFLGGLPQVLAQLGTAAGKQDWQVVDRLCHKLKTAVLFGYPELSEAAQGLGEAARKNQEKLVWDELARLERSIRQICRIQSLDEPMAARPLM